MKKYFSFSDYEGFELHDTPEAAEAAANNCLDNCRDEAMSEGWPEETDGICWGELKEFAKPQINGTIEFEGETVDAVEYALVSFSDA